MGKPTLEEAVYGIDERIKNILDQCNTTLYAGFLTQGRCFRYGVTNKYKANRKGGSPKPIIFHALKAYLNNNTSSGLYQSWRLTIWFAFILSRIIARPLSALLTKMYCISV